MEWKIFRKAVFTSLWDTEVGMWAYEKEQWVSE